MASVTYQTLTQILTREFRCPPEAIRPDSGFGDLGLHAEAAQADFVSAAEDALRLRIPAPGMDATAPWTLGAMCSVIEDAIALDAR